MAAETWNGRLGETSLPKQSPLLILKLTGASLNAGRDAPPGRPPHVHNLWRRRPTVSSGGAASFGYSNIASAIRIRRQGRQGRRAGRRERNLPAVRHGDSSGFHFPAR